MSVLDWVVILVAVPIITVALNQTYMYFFGADRKSQPKEESTGVKVKLVFVGLMTVLFMSALDQTVFSTALPTIVGDLHGVDLMLWITTAYVLASTLVMPVYGKFGDLFGHKAVLVTAIALFTVGSVMGGLAQNMEMLIAGRAVQGLGGGGLMIMAMAVIAVIVSPKERGRYTGIFGGVFAIASIVGPLIGGWAAESIGWRWVFWINLPFAAIAIVSTLVFIPHIKLNKGKVHIDYLGIALLMVASTCMVLATTWGGSKYAWSSHETITLFAVSALSFVLFFINENFAREPIFPLWMFKDRNFNLTTAISLIVGIAMFGAIAYVPTYMQMATGHSATVSGLLMLPMMFGMFTMSIATGRATSYYDHYKWLPIFGLLVVSGGLYCLSTLTAHTEIWHICLYLGVLGAGLGMCMQTLMLIAQNQFGVKVQGTVTGANRYFGQVGASLGAALVGNLFVTNLMNYLTEHMPPGVHMEGGAQSLNPELLKTLPPAVQEVVVTAYAEALAPVYLLVLPFTLAAFVLMWFVCEVPLRHETGLEELEAMAPQGVKSFVPEFDEEDVDWTYVPRHAKQ